MNPELPCPEQDWPRFSVLLDAAMDMTQAERTAWLDRLGAEDARLRPWLSRVLDMSQTETASALLPQPTLSSPGFKSGDRLGPYVLIASLGEGGMGEVWRARREDDGPKRDVALKLPHPAFLGGPFQRRFARERDVLAALSHPNIAQLYDAGSSAEGHPYLALELVLGEPVTEFCRLRRASLEQRVDLLCQVLDGLSYAHQRLIVHRDIKPNNVLVTGDGNAKLLDFGIAKLLGPEPDADAALTQVARLATPAYGAPEQFSGAPVTVATDIYAAGVLLFELLTGHRPFIRAPLETEAAPAPLASQRADAAAAGIAERGDIAHRLRGDLDAVIARALALDPASRYPSAEAFGSDLRRWRAGLPVLARRVGWLTRAEKFARRNRLGVALAAFLALSLLGGTAGIAWQARRAETAADQARQQAALAMAQAKRANAIKDFMIALFEASDPHAGARRADQMTAREMLDRGADKAEAAFADDPTTKIELLGTLADIFNALDDDRAVEILARRLALARQVHGDTDPGVIRDALDLVENRTQTLDYAAAQADLARVRQAVLQRFGNASLEWARWLTERSLSLRDTNGAREEIMRDLAEAVAIFSSHPIGRNDTTSIETFVGALYLLVLEQSAAEDFDAALATVGRMQGVVDRFLQNDPLERLGVAYTRATVLQHIGNLDEADAIFAAGMQQAEHMAGRTSRWFRAGIQHRAAIAAVRGNLPQAQAFFDMAGNSLKEGHSSTGRAYGEYLVMVGRGGEAVELLQANLAMARQRSQDENDVRSTEAALGQALDQAGRETEARAMLQEARNEYVQWGVPGASATLTARVRWARFLLDHGETAPARDEFLGVIDATHGAASAPAALAWAALSHISLAAGDLAQADTQSTRALRLLNGIHVSYDPRMKLDVWLARSEVLLATGHRSEALDLAVRAAAAADTCDAPVARQRLLAHRLVAEIGQAGKK